MRRGFAGRVWEDPIPSVRFSFGIDLPERPLHVLRAEDHRAPEVHGRAEEVAPRCVEVDARVVHEHGRDARLRVPQFVPPPRHVLERELGAVLERGEVRLGHLGQVMPLPSGFFA